MNNKIVLNNGTVYKLEDFHLSNLLNNERLLNELDMKNLPETFLGVLGTDYIDAYKPILLKKIELYDKSLSVNSFIYKGTPYWLDKQQRACMKMIAESGLDEVEIVFNDQTEVLPASFVKQFIIDLEVYAYKCYVNTAKHYQKASNLTNPKDILNYDYTIGYPEKLVLN